MILDKLKNLKKIKHKRAIVIALILLVSAAIITTVYYTNVVATAKDYAAAEQAFEEKDYRTAQAMFEALGDYKDSADRAKESNTLWLKNNYNHALSLFDEGEYRQALAILEGMGGEYEMSASLAEQCRGLIQQQEAFQNTDPQYAAYYTVLKAKLADYGKPKVVRDSAYDAKAYRVTGVSLAQVYDFNDDSTEELIVAHGGTFDVYGFISGKAQLLYSGDMQRCTAADYYAVEIATHSDTVDTLCIGSKYAGKELYLDGLEFKTLRTWRHDSGGAYYLDGKKVDKKTYYQTIPQFNYSGQFISENAPLEGYGDFYGGHALYATTFLSRSAASDLKNSVEAAYSTFFGSYERVNASK